MNQKSSGQPANTIADWLSYIETIHPVLIDPGLERTQLAAEKAELLKLPPQVILIGGTNGKGTTSRLLETILINKGLNVGVYNSPHITDFRERVRVNGKSASEADFVWSFQYIEQKREDISLSFFEFTTLAAIALLKKKDPDVILLEVGLGGRLDATNVVDPDVSVITTIDLDHQEWLGDTREQIAFEKAGIFRPGKPAVIGEPDLPSTAIDHAKSQATDLRQVNDAYSYTALADSWSWQSDYHQFTDLVLPRIPMQNAATAIATLEALGIEITHDELNEALSSTAVEGRFQVLRKRPMTIVDVAHNPQAVDYLADKIAALKLESNKQVTAIAGMLDDKEIETCLNRMDEVVDHWHVASLSEHRGASASRLKQALSQSTRSLTSWETMQEALEHVEDKISSGDILLIFGSFVTVSHAINFYQDIL